MQKNNSYRKNYSSRVRVNNYVYNNTSEAFELYPDSEMPSRRRRVRTKTEPNKEIVKADEHVPVLIFQLVVCGAFMAVFFFVSVYIVTMNHQMNSKIMYMNQEIEQVKQDNANLETEFDKNVDLTKIEKVAAEKLGMSKPRSYQVKYIEVPKESYTKQHIASEKPEAGFAEVINNLKNIFGG